MSTTGFIVYWEFCGTARDNQLMLALIAFLMLLIHQLLLERVNEQQQCYKAQAQMKTHKNWLLKFVHCYQCLFYQEPFGTMTTGTEK